MLKLYLLSESWNPITESHHGRVLLNYKLKKKKKVLEAFIKPDVFIDEIQRTLSQRLKGCLHGERNY